MTDPMSTDSGLYELAAKWINEHDVQYTRASVLAAFASEVRRSALAEARKLALAEKVSGETGTEGDEGYNAACDHIADAILALAERKE